MTKHTNTPVALATCVEQSLHMSLDGFDLKRARLYGISVVDAGGVDRLEDGALRITFLAEHGDVYELIDAPTSAIVRMFDAAVVLTCGWAAPIDRSDRSDESDDDDDDDDADGDDEKLPPSQQPQRRRVRLVVVVGDQGVGSVLRFADAPKEIVTDAGSARGSLADAVNNLWFDSPVHVARSSSAI